MLSSLDNVPWTLSLSEPTVQFDPTKLKKDTTDPETYSFIWNLYRTCYVRKKNQHMHFKSV